MALVLFGVDRLMLWLESRGHVNWRRTGRRDLPAEPVTGLDSLLAEPAAESDSPSADPLAELDGLPAEPTREGARRT
ncbi:hypothetical protein FHS43_004385 [Streptosporangium becharense]|uniref:Uncharacterized protein n=1 Tax=Streptosporangium becharense TaxID=1816182 RepID=A0A7W9MIJ9_9ACTN|nr:hypothetical protein [Streptosporangium becharense]MBB2913087.1 hypothetical protein [Streptosporangium becharense]MBB5822070.1 hypothetical protein [Streptosporangium becharense]